jgi:nucleotide-binding universal stress UspA family protein
VIEIKRILCPVDFSDFSRRALDYAVSLARWYEARVTALHVYPIGVPSAAMAPGAPAVIEPIVLSAVDRELLEKELAAFVEAEQASGVAVDAELVEGRVWREIVARADALEADLMVLGTHGRSGFDRIVLGSVTEKVLRSAPCPVLTVPRAASDAVPIAPGLFKRVLCPTDFSPAAERAVRWAMSIAQEADAELFMLHVLEAAAPADLEGFPRSSLAAYRKEYEAWSLRRLQREIPEAARVCCTVRELTAAGSAHKEILRAAEEHGCDLIVMGVGRHRGVGDRLFGSTTQHVVRTAACPVLTVREP